MKWQRFTNAPVAVLLKSPLHGLISGSILLITVTGKKTGHRYSTPVNYVRVPETDELLIVSNRDRTWWRNLRGGARVQILIMRWQIDAHGEVFEEPDQVVAGLLTVLRRVPDYRKHAGITLTADGDPSDPDAFERFARSRIIARLTTSDSDDSRSGQAQDVQQEEQTAGAEALVH